MARYLRPPSLAEALEALASNVTASDTDRLVPVVGATDFYPLAANREAWFQPTPANILDLSAIGGLGGIAADGEGLRIGALATWSDLMRQPLPPALDGLKQAARQVGGVQIQNRGTLVGNLCNASPAADGGPPLLALDAALELARWSDGAVVTRQVPLSAFTLGNRKTALMPAELVTAIMIPSHALQGKAAFLKLGARAYLVISIVSVAANIAVDEAGTITALRVAVGACAPVATRLSHLEQRLLGTSLDAASATTADLAVLSPIDDVRATAAYRREAALVAVNRVLAGFRATGALAA